jgi:hypothetical protein
LLVLVGCHDSDPNPVNMDSGVPMMDDDAGFPCDPSGLSKGPWSLAMTETSITVRWETCRSTAGGISVTPEAGGAETNVPATEKPFVVTTTKASGFPNAAPPDWAGTWYMHDAKVSGLTAGTCYRYVLDVDPKTSGRFCTAHKPGDPIRFMVIGDTDANLGTFTHDVLANVIPKKPEFTIHGGDIEYYADPQETWASWFPVVAPMLRQGAFMPATGNHEYESPTEYDQYTDRFFGGSGFDGTDHHYRFSSGGVWFFMMDTEDSLDISSDQGQWLASSLADAAQKPGFRFSIIVVHRLFLTCGDQSDHLDWLAAYTPLFDQYKVPIIIQAHMHGYERFETPNGRTFVTSAGGGGIIADPSANISRAYCNQRVVGGPFYHAMIMDVTAGKLSAVAIDDQNKIVDQFEKVVP